MMHARFCFNKIVFVIKRSMAEAFRELIESRIGADMEICYACQEYDSLPGGFMPPEGRARPYGTAHAVLAAKDIIQEPFAVIYADDFLAATHTRLHLHVSTVWQMASVRLRWWHIACAIPFPRMVM